MSDDIFILSHDKNNEFMPIIIPGLESMKKDKKTYITSRGVTVEFLPIMGEIESFNQSIHEPEPPTYEARPGVRFAYDEKSIQDEKTSAEDKAKWQEYLEAKEKSIENRGRGLIKLCLLKGIKAEPSLSFEAWKAEQEFFGADLADSPIELQFKYLYSQIIGNVNDAVKIMEGVTIASGHVPEELTAQAEATFRSRMGGDTTQAARDSAGKVEVKQPFRASAVRKQNRRAAE